MLSQANSVSIVTRLLDECGNGDRFTGEAGFSPVTVILPLLCAHLHLTNTYIGRTGGPSL
jgi:hypothetical protein